MNDTRLNVILDSGAYTAWRSGEPIDLKAYCAFLKANEEWITSYACLDVINPGHPEDAAAASMENYKIMRAQGLRPMPIFHVGEDVRWLKEMLDLGAEYIGLSASSLVSRNHVNSWYDMIWDQLVDSSGLPIVRCHAFGEGRPDPLKRNPWYSADSASWIYTAMRTATVNINGYKLSHRNDRLSSNAAPDIDALEGADKTAWAEMLAEHGISEAAFTRDATGHAIRTYLMALHYMRIEADVNKLCPIRYRSSGFFSKQLSLKKAVDIPKFNFHLVIGGNPVAAVAVALAGARNVLMSYAHLSTKLTQFTRFGDFINEPMSVISKDKSYLRHYNLLKEHINV